MCVSSVWTQPPYNDKNPPSPHFLILFKPNQSHKASRFDSLCNVTLHCIGLGRGGWLTALQYRSFSPQRLYAVLHFLRTRAAVTSTMSRKQSLCSVFGCKTEHKSLHFLPTSELLRMQWIAFLFQGNVPQNLPKYVYVYTHTAAQKFGISKICKVFKGVSSAHQGCIYSIRNTEKNSSELLLQFLILVSYFNIL